MSGFKADDDHTIFRCPERTACRWEGDLMLPGGLYVRCMACGWRRSVKDIEADMKAGTSWAALLAPLTRPELDALLADAEHAYVKSQVAVSCAPLDENVIYAAAGVAADDLALWMDALYESIYRHWHGEDCRG